MNTDERPVATEALSPTVLREELHRLMVQHLTAEPRLDAPGYVEGVRDAVDAIERIEAWVAEVDTTASFNPLLRDGESALAPVIARRLAARLASLTDALEDALTRIQTGPVAADDLRMLAAMSRVHDRLREIETFYGRSRAHPRDSAP